MRGLFPIGASPFTDADQLDLECLAAQVKFLNRGGVHGVIWPQIASEWTTLSKKERLDGAEAMTAAGKGGKTAITIGVQGPDMPTVLEFAKHAEKAGADAICSLPPANVTDDGALFDYYKQIGSATGLPLFVQSQPFPMSVDLIVRMYKEIPTFRQIKDEAGDTLARISEIRTKTGDGIKVFTGNGVRNMINELMLGAQGYCPTTDLADIYAQTFDLWYAGKHSKRSTCSAVCCASTASCKRPAHRRNMFWWRAESSRIPAAVEPAGTLRQDAAESRVQAAGARRRDHSTRKVRRP